MFYPLFFFLMIRRPPRSTLSSSSAASDVYKRQVLPEGLEPLRLHHFHSMVHLHHLSNHRHGRENRRISPYTDFALELFLEKQEVFFRDIFSTPCRKTQVPYDLSLIHISEPTRLLSISYAVFCLSQQNS